MTILSAATWPLLQDLQETKHKSGLFSCTATYIRPAGDTSLPTQIETSIGPVDVWPEPSVNKDTSGFDRITATGYGIWDGSVSEITTGLQLGKVEPGWNVFPLCKVPGGGCYYGIYRINCGQYFPFPTVEPTIPKDALFSTVFIKKIGESIPPLPETLKIYSITGEDISEALINFEEFRTFGNTITPVTHTGTFENTITFSTRVSQINRTAFGSVVETSVTYEITKAFVSFGTFYEIAQPGACDPAP